MSGTQGLAVEPPRDTETPRAGTPDAIRRDDLRAARNRPVLWWAGLGTAVIAFQAYVYTAWIASPNFKSTPTGANRVPETDKIFAWILQPVLVLLALTALIWVVRGCRRQGKLTLDAKLLIAGYCQLWLDPIGSLLRPEFFFNSYYVNFGSWIGQVPGGLTPNGHLLSDLPLLEAPVYGSMIFVCVGGCALMRAIRRRRPQTSNAALVIWTWVGLAVFLVVFEELVVLRTGAAVWLSPTSALTIFYGTRFQMSLIPDPFFWSIFMLAMICLRFFATDRGMPRSDSGLDEVAVPRHVKTTLSTLAVVGYVSAAMLFASSLAIGASLYSTTPRNLPSYLRDGICGQGTRYACPNPGVPIQTAPRPSVHR
jgi:hypothetical protein